MGVNVLNGYTKKISNVLQKLTAQAARYDGTEKKSFLLENDPGSKVMRVFQEDKEGDRTLLRDPQGDYDSIINIHFMPENVYWKNQIYFRDIDIETLLPYHLANQVMPY